jgi:hypothetical protein
MSGTKVLYSEDEKSEIQQQLERLLRNTHFSNSKRFPTFLRYIVREELNARGDQIKERTLGIEVFGRNAGYDTTSDPIVRVTAAEIRKRIAQYYQEPGHESELRISLPPGSYVPHFDRPATAGEPASARVLPRPQTGSSALPTAPPSPPSSLSFPEEQQTTVEIPRPPAAEGIAKWGWLVAAGLALVAITAWLSLPPRRSNLDLFWAPVLSSSDPVQLCFPQSHFDEITLRDAADPALQKQLREKVSTLVIDDLQPLVSLSGLLQQRHQLYHLVGEDTTTLTDLRQGPAILLGGFDNAWTLRVTRDLRYRFGNDPSMTHFWIEDTQSPGHTHWAVDRGLQVETNNYRDYAIVARFVDANTGKLAVVAAGIARGGTVAAGEFLTQASNMEAIKSRAPKNWGGRNMEFVLSTEIIDGRSSPPKIEATYFW